MFLESRTYERLWQSGIQQLKETIIKDKIALESTQVHSVSTQFGSCLSGACALAAGIAVDGAFWTKEAKFLRARENGVPKCYCRR